MRPWTPHRECAFCQIVAGATEADLVLESDDFVGFLDRRPVFTGHVLLVPRQRVVMGQYAARLRSALE